MLFVCAASFIYCPIQYYNTTANIRGGGEYGPKWHQAALKANRYKCYEDMEAVAQDLIDRKISSPSKLACIGGSNGGLMVGNLITRPISSKLFGAAVCQVPLLDMKVYSHLLAGASWMAEYGDPDKPEEWKYLRQHSPYHLLRHDNLGLFEEDSDEQGDGDVKNVDWVCPKVLFTTSTRDDRVHPGELSVIENENENIVCRDVILFYVVLDAM